MCCTYNASFDSNTTIITDSANVHITVPTENNVLQETDHKVSKESKCNDLSKAFDIYVHHLLQRGFSNRCQFLPQQNKE